MDVGTLRKLLLIQDVFKKSLSLMSSVFGPRIEIPLDWYVIPQLTKDWLMRTLLYHSAFGIDLHDSSITPLSDCYRPTEEAPWSLWTPKFPDRLDIQL